MKEQRLYQEKYEKALKIVNAYKRLHYGIQESMKSEIMWSHKSRSEKFKKIDELREQTINDVALLENAQIYL